MKITSEQLGLAHIYIAAQNADRPLTLLLLHGTSGDEFNLISLGRNLDSNSNILSPRGNVLENGLPRFFKRISNGVFDLEDLKKRTQELAEFVEKSSRIYSFDLDRVVAVGYSNGANIAASLLLLVPRLLAGAILFRPMLPLKPETKPDLSGISVLIMAGIHDNVIPKYQPIKFADLLCESGATVAVRWQDAAHNLSDGEIETAREWLEKFKAQA